MHHTIQWLCNGNFCICFSLLGDIYLCFAILKATSSTLGFLKRPPPLSERAANKILTLYDKCATDNDRHTMALEAEQRGKYIFLS